MDNENKILLNSVRTPSSVNVDSNIQFGITNTNKPIPLNDIDTTVSQFQQFEKERKKSTTYRFYGVVSPIISNPILVRLRSRPRNCTTNFTSAPLSINLDTFLHLVLKS